MFAGNEQRQHPWLVEFYSRKSENYLRAILPVTKGQLYGTVDTQRNTYNSTSDQCPCPEIDFGELVSVF